MDSEQVRVIDSNERIAAKLGDIQRANDQTDEAVFDYELADFGEFDLEGDENGDAVSALFSDEGSMEEGAEGFDVESGDGGEEDGAKESLAEMTRAQAAKANREAAQRIEAAKKEAARIIAQAQADAEELVEKARAESDIWSRDAFDTAKKQGLQEGYREGLEKANVEYEKKLSDLRAEEHELRESYEESLGNMESILVGKLTELYEHIFGVELSRYKGVLMHLITSTLHRTDGAGNYIVRVSSADFSYVSMQKSQIIDDGRLGKISLDVVEDATLAENECLIETANGIFDCSLNVQLEELKRKLVLLSYGDQQE